MWKQHEPYTKINNFIKHFQNLNLQQVFTNMWCNGAMYKSHTITTLETKSNIEHLV